MSERVGRERAQGRARVAALSIVLLVLVGAAALGAWLWLDYEFRSPGPAPGAVRIEVEPGTSVRTVLLRLETGGNLRNARAVEWYLRLHAVKPRMPVSYTHLTLPTICSV